MIEKMNDEINVIIPG